MNDSATNSKLDKIARNTRENDKIIVFLKTNDEKFAIISTEDDCKMHNNYLTMTRRVKLTKSRQVIFLDREVIWPMNHTLATGENQALISHDCNSDNQSYYEGFYAYSDLIDEVTSSFTSNYILLIIIGPMHGLTLRIRELNCWLAGFTYL